MKKKNGTIVQHCSPDPSFIQSTIGKANWNDHMRENVLDLYMDEMKRGGGTDNGLKSGYWTRISRQFSIDNYGMVYSSEQIQSMWLLI